MTHAVIAQLAGLDEAQLSRALAMIDALLPALHRRGGNVTGEVDISLHLLQRAGVLAAGLTATAPHLSAELLKQRKLVAFELARRLIGQAGWLAARDVLAGSRSVLRRGDDHLSHADVLVLLGRVDALLGYVERGRGRLRAAAELYAEHAGPPAAARVEMMLHRLRQQHDAPEATVEHFADMRQVYADLDEEQTQQAIEELSALVIEFMSR